LLHILCIFLGASLLPLSVLFCFVCCNKLLDPNKFLLEKTHPIFHCQEHSSFHSYRSTSVLFFLELHLAFIFCLDFCSDLVISLYQGVFRPLVYVSKRFEWCWKREKKSFMTIVVQMGACLDCGLDFCISCLMSFW
jgi:hypothetical protein